MPYGSRGFIGIKKEVTGNWGTRVATGNDAYLPFVTESIITNIEDLISAAQRGILDEPKSYQGERSFAGDVVLEVHPASIGYILRSAINEQYPTTPDPAGTAENVLENCEDAWDEADGKNEKVISGIDASDFKKGTKSVKLQVTGAVGVDEILATESVHETGISMVADNKIKLWIKCSKACTTEGDLVLMISEVAGCGGVEGTTLKSINLPTLVADVWKECAIDLTGMDPNFDAVISIGIMMHTDLGECVIHIDDIRRQVVTDATNAKQHIFLPRQATDFDPDCPLNSYSLEIYKDQDKSFEFLGAIVNTLALNFSTTDKILKATCGIIAKDGGLITKTGPPPALETTAPFVWENAVIWIGGTGDSDKNYDLESFGITYDNVCSAKYALNNDNVPRKFIRDGFRTIGVNFTIDFVDKTEYNLFLLGTERQFRIVFTGVACEENGNTYYYTLQIDLPKVRYLTYPINIGGPGRLTCAVTGKAKYDATAGVLYPIKFTLINITPTYQ